MIYFTTDFNTPVEENRKMLICPVLGKENYFIEIA